MPAKALLLPGWLWVGRRDVHLDVRSVKGKRMNSESRDRADGEWRRRQASRLPSPPPAAGRPPRCPPSLSLPGLLGAPPQGGPCSGGRPLSSAGSYERTRRDGVTGDRFQKDLRLQVCSQGSTNTAPCKIYLDVGSSSTDSVCSKYLFMAGGGGG